MPRISLPLRILFSVTVLTLACDKKDPQDLVDENAKLKKQFADAEAKLEAAPPATPAATAPPTNTPQGQKDAAPTVDMRYVFHGEDKQLTRAKLLSFPDGLDTSAKAEYVEKLDKALHDMQEDARTDPKLRLPRDVNDASIVWLALTKAEKLKLLENPALTPGVNPNDPRANWAAAAVGIAAATFVYDVGQDEKWWNDKQLREIKIKEFNPTELDHLRSLGKGPLSLPTFNK